MSISAGESDFAGEHDDLESNGTGRSRQSSFRGAVIEIPRPREARSFSPRGVCDERHGRPASLGRAACARRSCAADLEALAPRLCTLARSRLNLRIQVREDENDIVQNLFQSFFAAQQGQGLGLEGREELWRLLVWMSLCKVADAAHHHQRGRRDVRRERSPASSSGLFGGGTDRLAEVQDSRMLSPDDVVISRIELARILFRLRKDLRQIITWKLDGYTNAEIARKINRTEPHRRDQDATDPGDPQTRPVGSSRTRRQVWPQSIVRPMNSSTLSELSPIKPVARFNHVSRFTGRVGASR